ncbi:MAG: FAD-dependent oxidoreductase, partial [Candidatus Sulfotelmatobacter sp.]
MKSKPHIAVIGAGAFGGWTALHLLEGGARVTLLDAWGPGNSRASSGGETRIMRGTYGPDQPYTELAARALKLWPKYE